MKCDFCERDREEIKEKFAPIFEKLDNKIKELENNIQMEREKFPSENGFTEENFNNVDNINETILKMKISTILRDSDNFRKLDLNIGLLIDYIQKFSPDISDEKSLKDLLSLYKKEPTESRLNNAVLPLINQKDNLIKINNELKNKYDLFEEREIEFDVPLHIFNYKDETILHITNILKEIYGNDSSKDKKKMRLCPYCIYLFKDLSNDIIKVSERIQKGNINNGKDDNSSLKDWDFAR